jgi:hypothetical protein
LTHFQFVDVRLLPASAAVSLSPIHMEQPCGGGGQGGVGWEWGGRETTASAQNVFLTVMAENLQRKHEHQIITRGASRTHLSPAALREDLRRVPLESLERRKFNRVAEAREVRTPRLAGSLRLCPGVRADEDSLAPLRARRGARPVRADLASAPSEDGRGRRGRHRQLRGGGE